MKLNLFIITNFYKINKLYFRFFNMIVRETPENFIFITQHDHAYISGEFLMHFKKDFIPLDHYESLKFAVYQHERAWLIPDSCPLINDVTGKPFDFINYPEKLRLHFYKLGIDQIDQANSYAALLCSMHHASLYKNILIESGKQFYEREILRQKHLYNKLKIPHDRVLNYQFKIFQFCHELSLYTCINKSGNNKGEVVSYTKKGFPGSEFFHKNGETKISASFDENERNTIRFNSSPFEAPFEIKIPSKRVSKKLIADIGLAYAYENEVITTHTIKLT